MPQAVQLTEALARKLARVSAQQRRSPLALARKAISERLDYLEGRLSAIDAGFADLDKRPGLSTAAVLSELDAIIERHERPRRKTA